MMRRTHFAVALSLPLLAAACSSAMYAVPGELSSVSPLPVSGRQGVLINQRVSFGGYSTGEVRRSFTRGAEERDRMATDHGVYRQRYEFALNRGAAPVANVRCSAEGEGAQTLTVTWMSERSLECDVDMAGGEARAIRLKSGRDRPFSGRVTGEPAFGVEGSNRVKGGGRIDGVAGYTIVSDNGTPVAAVDLTGNGAVYAQGGEDDAVAAVIAALLLYQDPLQASERFRS